MNVAACVPYRPRDDDRPANLAVTRRPYDDLGWEVLLGDHPGDPFCRSWAINSAAARCPDADVLFVVDSDVLVPSEPQLLEAAAVALEHDCYTVAFSRLWVFGREGTEAVRAGVSPSRHGGVIESVALIWACAFAIPRALFDRCCGFDERFVGYGSEDLGFLACANTMGGPKQRVYGDAYHLIHPTNEERDHYLENARLASRYRGADGDPEAMRAILAERDCGCSS